MDPLKELDKEYKQMGSKDKTNFKVRHLELLLTAAKKEIIGFDRIPPKIKQTETEGSAYKTSSSELIAIPTLLIPSIQEELENNKVITHTQEDSNLTKQALKVFDVKKRKKDKERVNKRRITKVRKSTQRFAKSDERLALIQGKRAKLNLASIPSVDSDSLVATVSRYAINGVKGYLMSHYQETKTTEEGMKKIKSVRIKDGLEAAEHSTRRQGSIKNMIDALKREDRREEIKSSGVRLASR